MKEGWIYEESMEVQRKRVNKGRKGFGISDSDDLNVTGKSVSWGGKLRNCSGHRGPNK